MICWKYTMIKKTASSAILEQLASENHRILSDWRALLLLRRATFSTPPELRRWSSLPESVDDLYPLLRQMETRGEIAGLPKLRHIYQVTVPYARTATVQEDEILMEINPYAAISHLSALVYHGLTDDLPQELTTIVPSSYTGGLIPPGTTPTDWEDLPLVRGRRPDRILEWRVHWVRVPSNRYFGLREYQPQGYPVRVTMPERTLVDGLQEPHFCGGFENVLRAWVRARDTLDLDVLVEIVEQFDVAILRQRVGFILDQLDLPYPPVEKWRAGAKRGGSSKLLGTAPFDGTHISERWNMSINAPVAVLSENVA